MLSAEQARDLLEIVEDRLDVGSILVTSQVQVDRWHEMIGNPTIVICSTCRRSYATAIAASQSFCARDTVLSSVGV